MAAFRAFLSDVAGLDSGLLLFLAILIGLESLAPRAGAKVTVGSRLRAIAFWSVYNVVILLLFDLMWPLWAGFGVKPLLPALAPPGLPRPVSVVIASIAAAYVGDFFYYWCHRIQHRCFWRFHAIHHSVREMSGITSYHHVSEQVFKFILYMVPLTILTRDPFSVPILGSLLSFQGFYIHSPTRINFGPLGRYFVDNRFHRIHHSVETRHFDKNFGIFTTLWDSLFGTAYFPAPDEWPATGVEGLPEPQSVRDYLLAPFVRRRPPATDARPLALEA